MQIIVMFLSFWHPIPTEHPKIVSSEHFVKVVNAFPILIVITCEWLVELWFAAG